MYSTSITHETHSKFSLGLSSKSVIERKICNKNKVLIRFREINARYVADIQRCEIVDPSNQSTYWSF